MMLVLAVLAGLCATTYGQCAAGFVSRPGSRSCYYFLQSSLNWFDGDQYCTYSQPKTYKVKLATIEDSSERDWLRTYIRDRSTFRDKSWHIGGTRMDQSRGWVWAATQASFGYSDWDDGQPDGDSSRCAQMRESRSHRWGNYDCVSDRAWSVCEYTY